MSHILLLYIQLLDRFLGTYQALRENLSNVYVFSSMLQLYSKIHTECIHVCIAKHHQISILILISSFFYTISDGKVLLAQSYLTLCDPMDCSLPGPSVHKIFQARILEWVAISSSRGSSQTQGQKLYLLCPLHQQADSLPLSHLGVQFCLLFL